MPFYWNQLERKMARMQARIDGVRHRFEHFSRRAMTNLSPRLRKIFRSEAQRLIGVLSRQSKRLAKLSEML